MANLPRVMCARCGLAMVVAEVGVQVECCTRERVSYAKVSADVWACAGCGALVYSGYGTPTDPWELGYAQTPVQRVVVL